MQFSRVIFSCLFAVVLTSGVLRAQATGTISGVVQDESGAVIAGTNVTVINSGTGISRSVVSDAEGRYAVPALIPGQYEVRAEKPGFQTEVRKGLTLNVGSEIVIPLALKVGQVTAVTEVTAEAPIVETATNELSGLVAGNEVRDLPINGRSFDHLVELESSAPQYHPDAGNAAIGFNAQFTVNGALQTSNVYLMDGIELVGPSVATTAPGGVLGTNFGVDALQEFKILTGSYSAAYGKRDGAIINIATRSGTNDLHGSGFEFLRNNDMDARGFFDATHHEAPFKRNQFGATLGGPIQKDKTFFFLNYEGLRLRQQNTLIGLFPNQLARQGFFPCKAAPTFACNTATGLANVGVSPNIAPYLVLLPPINGPDFGDGTADAIRNPPSSATSNYYLARVDQKISEKDSLMGRYTENDQRNDVALTDPFFEADRLTRDKAGMMAWTRILSPTTLNTLRFGAVHAYTKDDTVPDGSNPAVANPALAFPGLGAPFVGRITFTAVGGGGATPYAPIGSSQPHRPYAVNYYDTSDQMTHQMGAHSLTFGGQVERIQHNEKYSFYDRGAYVFANALGLIQGTPTSWIAADLAVCPAAQGGPGSQNCNNGVKGYRQIYSSAFLQDDYKIRRNLTLNLGVRYEIMTVPTEVEGKISNYVPAIINGNLSVATQPVIGSPFYKGSHDDFAPRIGLAWDVFGNAKTAVRAGYGMFFDQVENVFMEITSNNGPFYNSLTVTNPPFPCGFCGGSLALPTGDGIDPNMKTPTRLQYNVSIQQEITHSTALTVGYVGSHAYHLAQLVDPNTAVPQVLPQGTPGCTLNPCEYFPAGLPRRNPQLGVMQEIYSTGDSTYQALLVDFQQRVSHGLRTKVSFTWSKNIEDNAAGFDTSYAVGSIQIAQMQGQNRSERSLSPYDVGRNLVLNLTYDLPFKQLLEKAPARLVNGWQLAAIAIVADGTPFTALDGFKNAPDSSRDTAQRPNLVAGASEDPVIGSPTQYFNVKSFVLPPAGFYGNLGRNTLIGPGFGNVDLTLEKTTAITERMKLLFRIEAFNLLNRANFGIPTNTVFSSNGSYAPTAGQITTILTPGRQLQFGLKLLF